MKVLTPSLKVNGNVDRFGSLILEFRKSDLLEKIENTESEHPEGLCQVWGSSLKNCRISEKFSLRRIIRLVGWLCFKWVSLTSVSFHWIVPLWSARMNLRYDRHSLQTTVVFCLVSDQRCSRISASWHVYICTVCSVWCDPSAACSSDLSCPADPRGPPLLCTHTRTLPFSLTVH